MKQVLLIRPYYLSEKSKHFDLSLPLGLLALATSLNQKNIPVKIIDTMVEEDYYSKIENELQHSLFVGITAMTAQLNHAVKIARLIKEKAPEKKIIWGGFHPTTFPEGTLESEYCDIVAIGESDQTIIEIYQNLSEKEPLNGVKGIVYKENNRVIKTPTRELNAEIPVLDYTLLENLELYIDQNLYPIEKEPKRSIQIHCGRGCFYQCTFCSENSSFKHRAKDAKTLVKEIKDLTQKYHLDYVDLQDSDFFANKKRLIEFIDLLLKENIQVKWFANCRANYFKENYLNDSLLRKIEKSQCTRLGIGVESGSDPMLKIIKKSITVEQVKKAITAINKTNIMLSYSFMIGMPEEKKEDMWRTLELMEYIENHCKRYYLIGPALYRPYPGNSMFEEAKKLGYKSPQTLREWSQTDFDYYGFISEKHLPFLKNKFKTLNYVRHIIDYRHLKKHLFSLPFYFLFKFLITIRLRYHFHFLLIEHNLLKFIRVFITYLKYSFGWLKKI